MYTIELMHVTGRYMNGNFAHTGRILFCKAHSLEEAKNISSVEMKHGYFNYANICGGDENINIERIYGHEWRSAT